MRNVVILCFNKKENVKPPRNKRKTAQKSSVEPSQGKETCEHRSQTQIQPLITKTQPLASNIFVLSR